MSEKITRCNAYYPPSIIRGRLEGSRASASFRCFVMKTGVTELKE